MRKRRKVVLTRHADVVLAARDTNTFSSVVSTHRAVPNGLDPPAHTHYRRLINPILSAARAAAFGPECRVLAARAALVVDGNRTEVAKRYAANVQCAYLDWPDEAVDGLLAWLDEKERAQAVGDRAALARNAAAFDELVAQRISQATGLTAELAAALSTDDLASVLRNWTVGEIGTIATSIVTLIEFLEAYPNVASGLSANPTNIAAMIEEVLRLHGPLASSRRIATQACVVAGQHLKAGDPVVIDWPGSNRDPTAFPAATVYSPERDQSNNLLYGVGIHACPGAPLARLELRLFVEEYLASRLAR